MNSKKLLVRQIKRYSSTNRPTTTLLQAPPATAKENVGSNLQKEEKKVATQTQKVNDKTLPKAPKLKTFSKKQLTINSFYSGYRPLFMQYKSETNNAKPMASIFDEDPKLWSYSSTGLEYYDEWETVPFDVAKRLKPFALENSDTDTTPVDPVAKGRKRFHSELYVKRIKEEQERKAEIKRLLRKKLNHSLAEED